MDIDLGSGKTFRIVAENFRRDRPNRHVQSATFDGKPLDTAWFRHGQIADGGTMRPVMGSRPSG